MHCDAESTAQPNVILTWHKYSYRFLQ